MIIWFRLLISLLPAAFRDDFGADIEEQVEIDLGVAKERGGVHAGTFVAATTVDLVWTACIERLRPSRGRWAALEGGGGLGTMSDWMRDLRLAGRSLRRAPGLAIVSVITLALAIGANAGMFSVVDAVLFDALPYEESEELVYIAASAPGSDFPEEFGLSMEFYLEYADKSEQLERVSSFNSFTSTLRVDDRVERISMVAPSWDLFETLGVTPLLGRLPTADDQNDVAIISHSLWVSWFGADPAAVGQSHFISGETRTIIGVMGPDFWFPHDRALLWIPVAPPTGEVRIGRFGMPLIARLAPEATHESVVGELTRIASRIPETYGGSAAYAELLAQHRPVVRSAAEEIFGDVATPMWLLLGAVALVLLIACANVANLFLVRVEQRQQDLAIRRALGAGRGALVRTTLAESFWIAAIAGAAALGVAWLFVPAFARAAPDGVLRLGSASVNASTLMFTAGAVLFATLVCGVLPAIRAARPRLTRLREAGRGAMGRRQWTRSALVVAQTALALVLLIGSGLLVRSFDALRNVDPGYDTDDLLTFQFAPERADLVDGAAWAAFHLDFADQLRALPGVESVGIVDNIPLNEGVNSRRYVTEQSPDPSDGGTLLSQTFSGEDYFATMGIEVFRGRPFQSEDHVSELGNVVISRSAAQLLWPNDAAVGQRLKPMDTEFWYTVVGVVDDVLQDDFRGEPAPMVYLPLQGPTPTSWAVGSPAYVVKTDRPEMIVPEVRALVRKVAPTAPMYRVFTMESLAEESMSRLSFTMLALGIAAIMAVLLGAIGLFGVLSFVVADRTREIGLRMALGAKASGVQRMVVGEGVRVVAIGVAIGLGAAFFTTRFLTNFLFGVDAADPWTFFGMAALMVAVGLLASYLPARRASTVDPIESLKGA